MTRALQVIAEHCKLRAADGKDMAIDEVSGHYYSPLALKQDDSRNKSINDDTNNSVCVFVLG